MYYYIGNSIVTLIIIATCSYLSKNKLKLYLCIKSPSKFVSIFKEFDRQERSY